MTDNTPTQEPAVKPAIDLDAFIVKHNAREEKYNKNGECVGVKWILPNLGELLFIELGYHFFTTVDNEEIYYYNGGYFEPNGEKLIKDWVERIQGETVTEHAKREVVGFIRDRNYQKREIFESEPYLLNLKNGIFDLDTMELLPHTPTKYFRNQLPIEYNKDAKIDKIQTFFEQVLRPEDILLMQEVFGYCLHRSYPIQKAVMFLGDGANGKSVTISLLKTFLGKENTCAISLQDIINSRFATSQLYSKLANLYPDIADEALQKTGLFKILTGGDMVSADQKFKDPFNFVNYAKLIFSANKLPEVHDDSDAYFRRWIFITFPNKFEGKNADKNLLAQLTTPAEISGLFNWSVEGRKRLLTQWDFTNTKTTDEMRETYQRLSSPIKAFVDDCTEIDSNEYITKDKLYSLFCEYCKKNNLPTVAKNTFSMRLHEFVKVEDYRTTEDGKRIQTWRGIKLKETLTTLTELKTETESVRDVKDVTPSSVLKQQKLNDDNSKLYISTRKNPDITDNPDTMEDAP